MRTIKRHICLEELKSRIPGLFPYIEFDELGNVVKHKATDSVDGCYGKIIPDLVVGGVTMSYRSLMMKYYAGEEMPKIGIYTFDDVVGKYEVDLTDYTEEQILVPAYVYAAEAKELLDKMIKLKKACESFTFNPVFCCQCDEYEKRGGDKMVEFLLEICKNAETIASSVVNVFGDDANVGFNVNLCGTVEDIGYYRRADSVECDNEVVYSDKSKNGVDAPWELPTDGNIGEGLTWSYDDGGNMVWVAKRDGLNWRVLKKTDGINISGSTDSKLNSLRRYTTYINDSGFDERPTDGTDWLYFYRKGYVANYETINDDLGNISVREGETRNEVVEGYENNLEAYGNVLYDIERDTEERTITFTYYINAHLKAKLARIGEDNDGNNIYYYKYPFEYESGGVKQTETYYYVEGGDIDELHDNKFASLVELYTLDENGKIEMDYAKTTNKKYEFFTSASTGLYNKTIFDRNVDIAFNISSFEYQSADVETSNDCSALFKEDYLMGVHYTPIQSSTVNIQRGNNAAFERHIKLGEVKTLEDMENYQNGTFFNIKTIT